MAIGGVKLNDSFGPGPSRGRLPVLSTISPCAGPVPGGINRIFLRGWALHRKAVRMNWRLSRVFYSSNSVQDHRSRAYTVLTFPPIPPIPPPCLHRGFRWHFSYYLAASVSSARCTFASSARASRRNLGSHRYPPPRLTHEM